MCTDVPTILSPVPASLVKLEGDWCWGSNVRSTIWGLLPVWRVTTAKLISRMTKLCSKCWKLLSEAQTGWRILGKSASSLWFYQVSEWYFNLLRYPGLEPQVILFFSFIFISWRLITLQYTFLYQARLVSAVITSGSSLCGLQQSAFILFLHLCCCFMCLVTQLCLTVCNPMTVAHQAPLSIGILQATILE